ncbi:hypothetical protein PoB_007388000 [Plakobranchus ocellatus]|uniref:Uncharacterized protein n=1 Tax=Plakobranchus ocellatus TaxID=259542 RepID=A0AAV4DTS1_9GAST|nr:hypothetical protein PoB_007388000 [Plakobranchus ocellatus]
MESYWFKHQFVTLFSNIRMWGVLPKQLKSRRSVLSSTSIPRRRLNSSVSASLNELSLTAENIVANIRPRVWTSATFPGKTVVNYLGLVLAVDGNKIQVHFALRICWRFFRWPHVDGIGWIPSYCLHLVATIDLDAWERIAVL